MRGVGRRRPFLARGQRLFLFEIDRPDRRHHQLIGQEAACGGAPTSLDKLNSVTVDLSF